MYASNAEQTPDNELKNSFKISMTEHKEKVNIGLRLASMFIDHFVMTFIMMIIVIPGFVGFFINAFNTDHEPSNMNIGLMLFLFAVGFSAYFCKDIFNGRSPAKRILKLQVIDIKTNEVATPLKCLVRNLTIVIWPIEVIFTLIDPKRRFGDRIAGTRIDYIENPEKKTTERKKLLTPILIALGFSLLVSFPFMILSNIMSHDKVEYIESTYNDEKSKQLNQIIELELSELIKKADFKFYSQIKDDNRQYLSGIIYFKNKVDYENFEENEDKITSILYKELPLNESIYFIKYIYKESGSVSYRQKKYDNHKSDE